MRSAMLGLLAMASMLGNGYSGPDDSAVKT